MSGEIVFIPEFSNCGSYRMDYWVESPLNKAHFYERKAKGYGKRLLYDEAINCHSCALAEFEKALKYTDNSKAIQSIKLQIENSERQKDYLNWKKLQHQAYMKAVKLQKEAMSRIMKASSIKEIECGKHDKRTTLANSLYRTIGESDSLLDLLAQKDTQNEEKENQSSQMQSLGVRRSKTVCMVVELQAINSNLRSLITELICEIMSKEREVKALEKKVIKMEAKTSVAKSKSANTQSSQFALSTVDEIVRAAAAQLPNLPPLELPDFDYSMFHSQEYESRGLLKE